MHLEFSITYSLILLSSGTDLSCTDMAANHPIHIHPARPLYRFTATALGASMWFFVRISRDYMANSANHYLFADL